MIEGKAEIHNNVDAAAIVHQVGGPEDFDDNYVPALELPGEILNPRNIEMLNYKIATIASKSEIGSARLQTIEPSTAVKVLSEPKQVQAKFITLKHKNEQKIFDNEIQDLAKSLLTAYPSNYSESEIGAPNLQTISKTKVAQPSTVKVSSPPQQLRFSIHHAPVKDQIMGDRAKARSDYQERKGRKELDKLNARFIKKLQDNTKNRQDLFFKKRIEQQRIDDLVNLAQEQPTIPGVPAALVIQEKLVFTTKLLKTIQEENETPINPVSALSQVRDNFVGLAWVPQVVEAQKEKLAIPHQVNYNVYPKRVETHPAAAKGIKGNTELELYRKPVEIPKFDSANAMITTNSGTTTKREAIARRVKGKVDYKESPTRSSSSKEKAQRYKQKVFQFERMQAEREASEKLQTERLAREKANKEEAAKIISDFFIKRKQGESKAKGKRIDEEQDSKPHINYLKTEEDDQGTSSKPRIREEEDQGRSSKRNLVNMDMDTEIQKAGQLIPFAISMLFPRRVQRTFNFVKEVTMEMEDADNESSIQAAAKRAVDKEAARLKKFAKEGVHVIRSKKGKIISQSLGKPGPYTRSGQSGTEPINREVTAFERTIRGDMDIGDEEKRLRKQKKKNRK